MSSKTTAYEDLKTAVDYARSMKGSRVDIVKADHIRQEVMDAAFAYVDAAAPSVEDGKLVTVPKTLLDELFTRAREGAGILKANAYTGPASRLKEAWEDVYNAAARPSTSPVPALPTSDLDVVARLTSAIRNILPALGIRARQDPTGELMRLGEKLEAEVEKVEDSLFPDGLVTQIRRAKEAEAASVHPVEEHPKTLEHEGRNWDRVEWPRYDEPPLEWLDLVVRFPDGKPRFFNNARPEDTFNRGAFMAYRECGCALYRPAEESKQPARIWVVRCPSCKALRGFYTAEDGEDAARAFLRPDESLLTMSLEIPGDYPSSCRCTSAMRKNALAAVTQEDEKR